MTDSTLHTLGRVLVVEDQRDLADLIAFNLRRAGYDVQLAHDGRAALDTIRKSTPDLVLLDVMLPEASGTEVASRLRASPPTAAIPIIMLTARADEVDQLVGLTVGADDYITKPFSMKVLLARIEAVLRRTRHAASPAADGAVLRFGGVELKRDTHEVTADGRPVRLTLTEFRLLDALLEAGGKILTRAQLMSRAMGPGITVTERTIDVHMTALRRKLGPAGAIIRTIRGRGYRLTQNPDH